MNLHGLRLELEFCCPKCGSYLFGSSQIGTAEMVRHCHGHGCRYSAPQTDDWKHFRVVSARFASPFQYESIERQLRQEDTGGQVTP